MLRVWLLGALALVLAGTAFAQVPPPAASTGAAATAAPAAVANPYSATVPVAGTSDVQRSAAISAALAQVLQQVSPGFAATPAELAQASGYVRTFHYRRAASGNGLELQVDFDPGAIGRLVAGGGAAATTATAGAAPAAAGSAGAPANAAGTTATAAATGGSGTLWIGGIDSSHAFASVLAMLRGDPQLQHVVPVGAAGDGVLLQVDFSGPLATILATLVTPGGHLVAAPQPHPGADATLRWVP